MNIRGANEFCHECWFDTVTCGATRGSLVHSTFIHLRFSSGIYASSIIFGGKSRLCALQDMGCSSSKVAQKPPIEVRPTTSRDGEGGATAEECRPALPTLEELLRATDESERSKSDKSRQRGHGDAAEGETIVDESGLTMRTPRRPSDRSLHVAAKSGDLSLVQDILSCTFSSSKPDFIDKDVLNQEDTEGAKSKQNSTSNPPGVEIDEVGMWGNTPLLVATQYAHSEIALALMEKGADVRAANERGATPLLYACAEGTADVVRALLEKGAEVDPPAAAIHHPGVHDSQTTELTPLISAAIGGHTELVRVLVESGAVVERRIANGSSGKTGEAVPAGSTSCEDGEEMSALTGAARYGHTDTVFLLIDNGANLLSRVSKYVAN